MPPMSLPSSATRNSEFGRVSRALYSAARPFGRAKDAVALLILRMILSEIDSDFGVMP
ncbi:hypothetical protein [Mesorhizobium sp.]|uniref:hypothetical protein n=1 Tax=Mesorhizobium sp. TaxID=1871066 RepID=UPI00257DC582|nr:hypothetical protein [Mesorhizobium sp.]